MQNEKVMGRPRKSGQDLRTNKIALHLSDAELEMFRATARTGGHHVAATIRTLALQSLQGHEDDRAGPHY